MATPGTASSLATPRLAAERAVRTVQQLQLRIPRRLRPAAYLAVASIATAFTALLQYLVLPRPSVAPFVLFYFGVALVAWLAGRGAGLLTVLLSAVVANRLFLPPFDRFSLSGVELRATILFALGASPVALLCGLFREALLDAHRTSLELAEQAALLQRTAQGARDSELRFRSLADAMPQLVWTARPDGTVDYCNRRSAAFAGIECRRDGTWSWPPVVHPDDVTATMAGWHRSIATGEEYQVEHRLQLADGTYRWHLTRGVPVRDEREAAVRWYGTATDIHEQKRAQEALQEADRRKDEFLGILSHELRNPLTPIRNSLHVAARAPPGSDQEHRALAVIERQVNQLTRLVDDLLDVTRIARGKVHLQRERVDLRALARQSVEDHEALFQQNGLDLELETADQGLFVHADPARLAQVIGNLLQNAAKFTPHGSRTTLSVQPAGDRNAEISVEDTGPGIPPDVLAHLFEPFVQAERSLDRTAGGLGLGLALVKGLVELHGGTVAAHSAGPGRGARFVITIPLERRTVARTAPAAEEGPVSRSARRILLIEDNLDAAMTLKEVLELAGHVVAIAYNGMEGLQAARAFRPDAVICDIGLPGMNGFEVARAIRADPDLRSTTLIALSGYALADDIDRARAAGFDLHLAKPPDLAALERSLAALRALRGRDGAGP